ncbi:hypothetical protein Ae201684P_010140 [Aphanomyces euteiches]|nr:hypothetical protein Ae201684P_010140 [Aphanomyces euteiches]
MSAAAVNPKTQAIAELMNKLKSGAISKAELFMQLSKLQPTNSVETASNLKQNTATAAENEQKALLQPLYDEHRAGVSHDQAKRISVQQLLASRGKSHTAVEEAPVSPTDISLEPTSMALAQPNANYQDEAMSEGSKSSQVDDYESPPRYGHYMDEDSFHARVSRWKQQKENLKEKLKQEQLEIELTECTFQPAINPKSQKVASKLRHQNTDSVAERLYKDVINYKLREELAMKTRQQEEEAEQRECTFRPHLSKSISSVRSNQPPQEVPEVEGSVISDRRTQNEDSLPQSDASCSGEAEAERKQKFQEFIRRQLAQEHERQRKLEEARKNRALAFKPNINKKSNEIMQQGRKGDFIERVAKYALRKEHEKLKKKSIKLMDPQCTFKPKINDVSAKRTPRSVTELSRGDLLKRETSQRLMKLRMEQHEMTQLTFKPAVNLAIPHVESKLKVVSDPENYVQRLQEHTLKLYEKQRKALQEQEIQEFSECTFKPQTIQVPSYISRIAKSMELTKAHKPQPRTPSRPEWK